MVNTMRLLIGPIICGILCIAVPLASQATGDSLHYLTAKDTIFLKLGTFQEKIFEHRIAQKQTLFSLAKFYGLNLTQLYYYNPELKNNSVPLDYPVRIPIPNRAILRYPPADFNPQVYTPVCYKVKKGDNLYNIAKRVFRMPVDTVMLRNEMTDFNLKIGQVLQLGWMSLDGISTEVRKKNIPPEWKQSYELRGLYLQAKEIKREREERGAAYWQKSGNTSNLVALHRYAPIKSIIAIRNPMSKRTVYAKVIGRIPENVYRENVVVVVSNRVAQLLGAKDAQFFVKLRYLK